MGLDLTIGRIKAPAPIRPADIFTEASKPPVGSGLKGTGPKPEGMFDAKKALGGGVGLDMGSMVTKRGSILHKGEEDAISGFYYDQQLDNPALVMSLHPNKIPNPDWQETDDPSSYWKDISGNQEDADHYLKEPIAKAIVGEDFQIGIANQWEDHSMGNDLTDFFNSLKPLAPFADLVATGTKEGKEAAQEKLDDGSIRAESGAGSGAQDLLQTGIGVINKVANTGAKFLNRALIIQGSRFSYYNGTGVAFGNLSMKFTLFSDWDEEGNWNSCIDKVKKLTPYVIGKYINGMKEITDNEVINQFVGWQLPPAGFTPDLKNIDVIQQGTLKVRFAGLYSITNLVISDAQFSFSKQTVKCPLSTEEIDICPMYCDVVLTLRPASKYTGESFDKAVSGDGVQEMRNSYLDEINKRLKKLNQSYRL